LGDLYKQKIMEAIQANDYETQLFYVNNILREIPRSALVPEMMYRRINLYLDYRGDSDGAWQDYMDLFDNYPNDSYEVAARKSMERIVPNKKAYGQRLAQAGYYNEALTQFFELAKYPVVKTSEINDLIGDAYRGQAEEYLHAGDYLEADRFLRIALQYVPEKRPQIEAKLQEIVGLFINKGDEYLAIKDFDTAMTYYQKVFEIIPDYPPGLQAIQRLNTTKQNIARAALLFEQGQRSEASGKYAEALGLYQQANSLDSSAEIQKHIAGVQNMIEADRNPQAFARKIINQYRGGLLINRVNQKKNELLANYKANEVRDSGWKFLLSTSQYKYEVRYDLMSPRDTFFYVWQVNLKDRSIIPLNKISEDLMK
jgi:tetratricopeptide (TPR) repeat protein